MPTPYQGAKPKCRRFSAWRAKATTVQGGGSASRGTSKRPSRFRMCSICAVARSLLTKTLRLPMCCACPVVEFVVVGEHRVVGQILDQMQVHHGGLYRGMPELPLHEHDGLDAVAVPSALQGYEGVR